MEDEGVADIEVNVFYNSNPVERVFQNGVVVRTLLQLLSAKYILKFRLLNRFFNQIACSVLYNTVRPTVRLRHAKKPIESFLATFRNHDPQTKFPFTSFKLDIGDVCFPLFLVQNFVKLVGPNVTEYKIWLKENQEAKLVALLSNCARLEKLNLNVADKPLQLRWKRLKGLPKSFPHLRLLQTQAFSSLKTEKGDLSVYVAHRAPILDHVVLTLTPRSGEDERTNERTTTPCLQLLPEFLHEVCRKPPKLSLRTTVYNSCSPSAILDGLSSLNYNRLVSFHFNALHGDEELLNSLHDLMELQSESLADLEMNLHIRLFRTADAHTHLLRFPILKKLRRLNMKVLVANNIADDLIISIVRPFEVDQFRQLRVLKFELYTRLQWFSEGFVAPTLKLLTIVKYVGLGSANNETFHLNFPNLKSFKVHDYDSISLLEYVLREMTNLVTLSMGHCRDSLIGDGTGLRFIYTGQMSPVSKEFNADTLVSDNGPSSENENIPGDVASLGNFKALKILRLTVTTLMEVEALVDMSDSGKLRRLDALIIRFACQEDHPSYRNCKGYDAGLNSALIRPKDKAILERCHKMVRYRYVFI